MFAPCNCLRYLLVTLCLAVRGEDQVVNSPLDCTAESCSGFTVEFEAGSEVAWNCNEQSACENTTFIVNNGSTIVERLDCDYDRGCYNAKIIVRDSDLEDDNFHLDCNAGDTGVTDACNWLNLSLFDSLLDATSDESNFQHVQAHLYGASMFELRPTSSLPSDNQLQVFLYDSNAVFRRSYKKNFVLNTYSKVGCYALSNVASCGGSTIRFMTGSAVEWHCHEASACENTTFIVDNSSIAGELNCDTANRACYNSSVFIKSSDLSKGSPLVCHYDTGADEEVCQYMSVSLEHSSKLSLLCDSENCKFMDAQIYDNSQFILVGSYGMPATDRIQVHLYGADALLIDNGNGPYDLYTPHFVSCGPHSALKACSGSKIEFVSGADVEWNCVGTSDVTKQPKSLLILISKHQLTK